MTGICNAGVRLGCYGPMKDLLGATKENNSIVRNIAAGSLSGALAAWATNPVDLVKTRLQSKQNPYKTSSDVVKAIVREDGVKGLWAGTVPSVVILYSKFYNCQRHHAKDSAIETGLKGVLSLTNLLRTLSNVSSKNQLESVPARMIQAVSRK